MNRIVIELFRGESLKRARHGNRWIGETNYVIFHIHINVGYIGIRKVETFR